VFVSALQQAASDYRGEHTRALWEGLVARGLLPPELGPEADPLRGWAGDVWCGRAPKAVKARTTGPLEADFVEGPLGDFLKARLPGVLPQQDRVVLGKGDLLAVTEQQVGSHNGIYRVTQRGKSRVGWELQREPLTGDGVLHVRRGLCYMATRGVFVGGRFSPMAMNVPRGHASFEVCDGCLCNPVPARQHLLLWAALGAPTILRAEAQVREVHQTFFGGERPSKIIWRAGGRRPTHSETLACPLPSGLGVDAFTPEVVRVWQPTT